MNIYEKIYKNIMKIRVANKKIYKPILILSYVNYLEEHTDTDFNTLIDINLLIDYITIYMEDEQLRLHLFNDKNIDIMKIYENDFDKYQKIIITKFRKMPLSKIINDNKQFNFFQTNLTIQNTPQPVSRCLDDLPKSFMIHINEQYDKQTLIDTIKLACSELVNKITNTTIEMNIISNIEKTKYDERILWENELYETLDDTTKKTLTTSRKGQHVYRKKLIHKYHCTCALCSINLPDLLTASHAKPWRSCIGVHERLSENNGLLLCKNHDALFDRGLITINWENKSVIFSPQLDNTFIEQKVSGTYDKLKISLDERSKKYIMYHNKYIFKN